jgi:hypothetical protein
MAITTRMLCVIDSQLHVMQNTFTQKLLLISRPVIYTRFLISSFNVP